MPIEEIVVSGDHGPVVAISDPDDLDIRRPVSVSELAGVHDIVAE